MLPSCKFHVTVLTVWCKPAVLRRPSTERVSFKSREGMGLPNNDSSEIEPCPNVNIYDSIVMREDLLIISVFNALSLRQLR